MRTNALLKSERIPQTINKKWKFTADEYQAMGAAGIFEGKPRVELIDGEIITMSAFTPAQNNHVDKASGFFNYHLYQKAIVRTQGSIRTDNNSEPEPDLTVLQNGVIKNSNVQATGKDAYLVVEVAVTTLTRDRTIKKEKYATADIPEYWIIAPYEEIIEVYKKPLNSDYAEKTTYTKDSEWIFEAFDLKVKGSDFLI